MEAPNKKEQLWNRISSFNNTQFAFKSASGTDLYLTAPDVGKGVSSLTAKSVEYGTNVVVEYLSLTDEGECCIDSQLWKPTNDNPHFQKSNV